MSGRNQDPIWKYYKRTSTNNGIRVHAINVEK